MQAPSVGSKTAHAISAALFVTIAADPANAQDDTSARPVETIDVVGSNIGDGGLAGMSPVLTLSRQTIERSGALGISDVLQRLPVDNAGTFNDRDALSAALGGSSVSLRGIGVASTLVLINGRRAATYPLAHVALGGPVSFVDLNSIPMAAVERIEVLKDNASAIYGSDASAGVINIVLRDDLDGTSVELRRGTAENAHEQAASVVSSWTAPRTSVSLIATYSDREQLAWRDREVSASANREAQGGVDNRSLAAVNFLVGGVGNFGADCESRNTTDGVPAYTQLPEYGVCVFDPNAEIVVPSARRAGLTMTSSHDLRTDLRLNIEASYLAAEAHGKRDPVAWLDGPFPGVNPWNDFGGDLLAEYRFSEVGPRLDSVEVNNARLVAELEGELGDWQWTYSALYQEAAADNRGEGYLSGDRVAQALRGVDLDGDGLLQQDEFLNLYSPAANPNSSALLNSLKVTTLRQSTTTLKSHLFRMARRLFQRRAGDVLGAFGLEHLEESLDDESDPLSVGSLLAATSASRNWFGMRVDRPFAEIDPNAYVFPWDVPHAPLQPTGFPSSHGTHTRNGLFGELHIPVLPQLHLQAALRYEDLMELDAEAASRIALRYDGFARARIRASWGRGFRAPSLVETNLGPAAKLQASWDPKRCPEPGLLIAERAGGCAVRSFVATTLGNPLLETESSESWSIGADLRPFDRHNVALDCWRTRLDDKIVWAQTAWMIRNEDRLPPGLVVRDPLGADELVFAQPREAYPGTIAAINLVPLNFGWQNVEGCDVEVTSTWDAGGAGSFEAQLLATRMASNVLAFEAGEASEELAGTYGHPHNRAALHLIWSRSAWEVGLYGRWTDGFDDTLPGREVPGRAEWDTQLSYSGWRSVRLTLGVENLLDEAPPASLGEDHLQGFPVELYDMRGRFVYAEARFAIGQRSSASGVSR